MAKTVVVVLFISCLILSTQASAQENEVSLSLGATFTPGSHTSVGFLPVACPINNPSCGAFVERFHVSTQISYQGLYARRFLQRPVASLYAELPVVGVPSRTLGSTTENLFGPGTNTIRRDFSSVFITPSLRAKFLPDAPISPFASFGVGVAHFSSHESGSGFFAVDLPPRFGETVGNNTLAYQFGAGVDFKTPFRHLGFRLEVRDFVTGRPAFDFAPGNHRNNVFTGGGLVFHF
jgi:hypothetical protein